MTAGTVGIGGPGEIPAGGTNSSQTVVGIGSIWVLLYDRTVEFLAGIPVSGGKQAAREP